MSGSLIKRELILGIEEQINNGTRFVDSVVLSIVGTRNGVVPSFRDNCVITETINRGPVAPPVVVVTTTYYGQTRPGRLFQWCAQKFCGF